MLSFGFGCWLIVWFSMWCPIFVSWTSVLAPPQSHRRQQFGYEGSRKSKERSIRRHFHSNPPNSPLLSGWSDRLGHKVIRSLLGQLPTHPIHQSRTLSLTLKISPQNTTVDQQFSLSVKDQGLRKCPSLKMAGSPPST